MLLEEGDQESIMEMLEPMVEQNQSTLSMGNKLEVRITSAAVLVLS